MKVNNNIQPQVAPAPISKKTSFTGKNFLANVMEPPRNGTMPRKVFIAAAFAFLLSGRLISSRDKNEKRETLTRDIPTIVIAVMGVPVIEKFIASKFQKRTGFAILDNPKNYKDGIVSGEKIHDWYKLDKNLSSGFEGFAKRISDLGGNMKKISSYLSADIKAKIANFADDNVKFLEELSKNKELKQSIEEGFAKEGNGALKQASYLKAMPKVLGIGLTLAIIGLFIPKLNIFITESVNKQKKPDANEKQATPTLSEVVAPIKS